MSNTITPKISEELKKIASADKSGQSKAKIDTKHEYDLLKNYLANNLEEFTPEEKNTLNSLLDRAKHMLGLKDDTKTKEETTDSSNEAKEDIAKDPTTNLEENSSQDTTDSSNEPEDDIAKDPTTNLEENSSQNETDSSNEPQKDVATDPTTKPEDTSSEDTTDSSNKPQQDQETEPANPEDPANEYMSKNKTDSSNEPQKDQETESGKTNEHGTVTKDDDSKQDGNTKQKGEKVVIDGKICIKMPSGELYDARTGRKIKS